MHLCMFGIEIELGLFQNAGFQAIFPVPPFEAQA